MCVYVPITTTDAHASDESFLCMCARVRVCVVRVRLNVFLVSVYLCICICVCVCVHVRARLVWWEVGGLEGGHLINPKGRRGHSAHIAYM